MAIKLTEVTGIPHALDALRQSKRHANYDAYMEDVSFYRRVTDIHGFFYPSEVLSSDQHDKIKNDLSRLAKYGAGVDQGDNGSWLDAGHETLLRYIDFTFEVSDLHRGAMDDLDSHAKRFENRIVRSSTRLGRYAQGEVSPWYKDKIMSTEDMLTVLGTNIPTETVVDGIEYVKSTNGYVRKDMAEDNDVLRGNYPLAIPMSAIMRINFVDLRHVYMRRNKYTHANPELRENIESLADQIEAAIPYDLGKLIRYDYAYDPQTNDYHLAHIMSIKKVIDNSRVQDCERDH